MTVDAAPPRTGLDDAAVMALHVANMRLRGLRETSIRVRLVVLKRLSRHLAAIPLLDATYPYLAAFQATYADKAPATVRAYTVHVRAFYQWATAEELVDRDPSLRLIRPQLPWRLPRPIAEDDLRFAWDAAQGDTELRVMLALGAFCGLRAMEMAGLTREGVEDHRTPPTLRVIGKGDKERVVPCPPVVLEALRVHGLPSSGLLLPRASDGGPYRPTAVSHKLAVFFRRLGIPATGHQLRHRYATQVYELSGGDLRVTQELLGHASPETTAVYAAASPRRAQAAVTALSAAWLTPID